MQCHCGFDNADEARFCLSCGAPLRAAAATGSVAGAAATESRPAAAHPWIRRNRGWLVAGLAVALMASYQLFLRADPERDGKKAARTLCACLEARNEGLVSAANDFLGSFQSYNFERRQDARAKFEDIQRPVHAAQSQCATEASAAYTRLKSRYVTNGVDLGKFEFAFNGQRSLCSAEGQGDVTASTAAVQRQIETISDPEPTIDQIKADLIGQQVPGWRFAYLSEFKSADIANASKTGNRIEYRIAFHLRDDQTTTEHDMEAAVNYLLGDSGWRFEGVRELSITYDNLIPVDNWTTITPLANCAFSVADDKKLLWKTSAWGPEIRSGPDAPGVQLPSSNRYLVKSREPEPVVVRFTYRPR